MLRVEVRVLGELKLLQDGVAIQLPASKRTRALLAYLAITARPHRRDRLCGMFWELPNDPRGALRWSLSKLRPYVNDVHYSRLNADRERVSLLDVEVDVHRAELNLESSRLSVVELKEIIQDLSRPLLDGIDLPDQDGFQEWLMAERREIEQLHLKAVGMLAQHPDLPPEQMLETAERWIELEPYHKDAASLYVQRLDQFNHLLEAEQKTRELKVRFDGVGVKWSPEPQIKKAEPPVETARHYQNRQKIQFCSAPDKARIAYASVGEGQTILKAANWLSHLELDWHAPVWSPLFRELAHEFRFLRYDERGNGLSDWEVDDISFDAFVTDLETVADEATDAPFALLGISQGAAVSIEYAVRHSERVSCLVLFGGYPAGWRIGATAEVIKEREAVMTLTESGWGQDNPAYRQIFSSTFLPDATMVELNWFNDFQRATTSPANAVRFLEAFGDIDVRDQLEKISVPTLVIHSRGDRRIPVSTGRQLAESVPGAQFLELKSDGHLLLGREPASREFVNAVREFVRLHRE